MRPGTLAYWRDPDDELCSGVVVIEDISYEGGTALVRHQGADIGEEFEVPITELETL